MDNPTNLIIVEDNPQDVQLFKYALSQAGTDINLIHYENGRDFVEALPDLYPANIALVLLDLNMPFMGGHEVLEGVKKMKDYKHVPIIMFTNTNTNEDKAKCYDLGASAYVSKPLELEDLVRFVKGICDFWINVNDRVV